MEQIGGAVRRIRPVSLIGEGRHGQVYVAMDEVLRRRVVIKRLAPQSFPSASSRMRLIEEARILSRVDHPNILRIHDYSEQEGNDVFTLEFAGGAKLSAALEHGLDFAKKVRIATAVASALVIAHRNGIVHGALSSDSVMLTDQGEIKVVDFHSTSTSLERRQVDPRWQSPEQQRTGAASRAADMYGFGVLLREMFGERDRDVRALVASLLREAPSERGTAAVTLGALHQLGRRRARRLRVAAIALLPALFLAGAVKYTVDLRRERSEALAAKAEADARRQEATKLVEFMIRNLRPKLDSVGRLDILDSATTKGLDYFSSLGAEDISPNEAAIHVDALVHLGETRLSRSNVADALTALQRAVSIGEAMLRRQPDNVELRFSLARAHARTAMALDRSGHYADGLGHSRAATSAIAEVVRRAPREVRYRTEEAVMQSNLGSIHDRREEIAASLEAFRTAVTLKQRILQLEPTDEMRLELSVTVHKVGMALFKLGRFAEARSMLEKERAQLEQMLVRKSRDQLLRELIARNAEHLALTAFAMGDIPAAARDSAAQLATGRELVAFDPDNIDWRRHVVAGHRSSGTAARLSGDVQGALRHHAAAIDVLTGVFAAHGRTTTLARELGMARVEHARSLLAARLPAAAEEEAHRAAEELRVIRNDVPGRRLLGDALLVEGEARAARGDAAGAAAVYEQALSVLSALDAVSPDPRVTDSHARVLLRLGRTEHAQPLIEALAAIGYLHPELKALLAERKERTHGLG